MNEEIVKINKKQTKILLNMITTDNNEYGLIFKLCYIYGRLISEVYQVNSDMIDFEKNTINFKINDNYVEFNIHHSVKEDLKLQVKEHNGFIFHHIGLSNFDKFNKHLNYYLKKYDELYGVHISPRDFKKLRGQHLLCDGVDVNSITGLYCNGDNSATKRLIEYNNLLNLKEYSVNEILIMFTEV